MANIININDRRKKEKPSLKALSDAAIDFISNDWEKFARNNRLNDFFISFAGVLANPSINYLDDLNAISQLEDKLNICVIIKSPYRSVIGWRASFLLNTATITTPDLPFETYARCFNILLFIKLKKDLVLHNMTDEL